MFAALHVIKNASLDTPPSFPLLGYMIFAECGQGLGSRCLTSIEARPVLIQLVYTVFGSASMSIARF
jgi:hypothetical protein